MKVVITGGAGFIGSHLVDYYMSRGNDVIVIDNLITGLEENVAHYFGNKKFNFYKQDICNRLKISQEIDLILHFASPASPFDYLKYPLETMRTASFGTHNLLELAKKKRARFFLASTSEVYGDPDIHPQREEYWGNVNPVGPRAVYDEGKRFAEAMTIAYHRKYNLKVNIIRIFNTYGERMREGDGRVIPALIANALRNKPMPIFGNGKQTRSFCYIKDMVNGIVKLSKSSYPMPVNIGNPGEFMILELAGIIKKLTGSKSKYKYYPLPQDDPRKRKPDISKAKRLLGWEPKYDLEQGLGRLIEWFRKKIAEE